MNAFSVLLANCPLANRHLSINANNNIERHMASLIELEARPIRAGNEPARVVFKSYEELFSSWRL